MTAEHCRKEEEPSVPQSHAHLHGYYRQVCRVYLLPIICASILPA